MRFNSPLMSCIFLRAFSSSRATSLLVKIFIASSRFWSWLRSFWQVTTMPVGMCVILTAVSTLFTFWPPAPPLRYVSIFKSSLLIFTVVSLLIAGTTSTDAKLVWRRLLLSNGLILTSLWTPISPFSFP